MAVELEASTAGIFIEAFGYDVWIERAGGMIDDHPEGKRWGLHRERCSHYLYAGPFVCTWGRKAVPAA